MPLISKNPVWLPRPKKGQAFDPIQKAKLDLIKAQIAVEEAKLEQIKRASNPLALSPEAVRNQDHFSSKEGQVSTEQ